jgi:GNAT superfamily N-acetyltransferase
VAEGAVPPGGVGSRDGVGSGGGVRSGGGVGTGGVGTGGVGSGGEVASVGADVRLAGLRDGPAVAALRAAWTAEDSGLADDPTYVERFSAWWVEESERRLVWLAWVGDEPVGMLNLAVFERMPRPGRPPSRWGWVGNAYVLPGRRSRGIGRALLDAALAHARSAGFVRVVLAPSERSIGFYSQAGFAPATSLLLREPP